jgi:autotransporter-associated beta strand protein
VNPNRLKSQSSLLMKKHLVPSILVAALSIAPALRGADYFWDANGSAANTGGTGTWGTANTWRAGSVTGTLGSWVDGNAAVFAGVSGITTLTASVSPSELRLSVNNHNVIGAGPLNFGAAGAINFTGTIGGIEITTPLAGAVSITPTNAATTIAATFKADSAGLTAVTLSGSEPNRHVLLDHGGAFGPAGTPVSINNCILGIAALTTESIGLASGVANGTGGGLSFPAWNLILGTNAAIRVRAGANTLNSPMTLTGNATLLTRAAGGIKLTLSSTATVDLGGNTLFLHSGSSSDGVVLYGAISGIGGITQATSTLSLAAGAAGTSTIAGVNTYTGPTAINVGHLLLTGSLTSNVTLASGSNLGGEGSTTGSVTFSGTHTLTFDPSTAQALTVGSVNAAAATITLTPINSTVGSGLVILDAPGGITGTVGTNFLFSGRGTAYLNGDSTKLLFDPAPATLKWAGNAAGNPSGWDTNGTENWINTGSSDKFLAGDNVVFDETAAVFGVTVQGANVQPNSVLISGPTDYTIGGAPIAGLGSLTKNGAATAILTANNSYSGGTIISAGILQLGDGTAATGSAGAGSIANNGTLLLNHGAAVTFSNAVTDSGSFAKSGAGTVSITGDVACSGGVTISAGTLQIGNNTFSGTLAGDIVNNSTLSFYRQDPTTVGNNISGSGGLSKTQGASVTLTGSNNFSGPVTVSGANTTLIAGSATALGDATSSTSVNTGGRLVLANGVTVSGETISLGGSSTSFNGALQAAAGATATWGGPVTLDSGDARIGTEVGGTLIVTGSIQNGTGNALNIGAGSGGTGTVVLATPLSSNTYTGSTNIIRGTVKLGEEDTLPPTTILDVDFSTAVEPSVFDLNGKNQSASGLRRTGVGAGGSSRVTNSSATAATLTLNQNVTTTYNGEVTGNLALVKDGSGQLSLTGTISYAGSTRIKAGTLALAQVGLSDTAAFTIDSGAVAALNFTGNDRVGSLTINGAMLANGIYSATSHGGLYAASFTGAGALQVGATGYEAWIGGYPSLTGNDALPGADAEGDGLANLLEFVLGGNPTAGSDNVLPSPSNAGGNLTLTFKRNDDSEGDSTLTLQTSTDLASWPIASDIVIGAVSDTSGALPGGVTYTVNENGAAPDDVVITLPAGPDQRKFSRIKAAR